MLILLKIIYYFNILLHELKIILSNIHFVEYTWAVLWNMKEFLFKLCQKINTETVFLVNVQKYIADRDNTDNWINEPSKTILRTQ